MAQPDGGAASVAFMPFAGLWWNPDESGSGYNIQMQHGVTVATIFSYTAAGDPVWYYAFGPLTNAGGGVAVTGTHARPPNGRRGEGVPRVSSFRSGEFMKALLSMAVGAVPLLAPGVSFAQTGNMMGGGMGDYGWMGGYGGIWTPILLVIVVVGLVAWVVKQKGK